MQYNTFKHRIFNCNVFKNTNHDFKVKKKKNATYFSYADLDHTCRNPTRHDVIDFDPPQCRVSSLCLPIFQALHRKSWDALIHLAGNES